MNSLYFKMIFTSFYLFLQYNCLNLSCLDQNSHAVDWWVIFMLPKTKSEESIQYAYFDNKSEFFKYFYLDDDFPALITTDVVNDKTQKKNYFFWNDDSTSDRTGKSKSRRSRAHSKGGIVYNNESGFLLLHSLPRFPQISRGKIVFDLPSNAGIYAQSWICVSLDRFNVNQILSMIDFINADIYFKVRKDQIESYNVLTDKLIKNKENKNEYSDSINEFYSFGKNKFTLFSKGKFNEDLPWDVSIPNYYNDYFFVETWTKPKRLGNLCNHPFKGVLNVLKLKFNNNIYNFNKEHGKWGISMNEAKSVICLGDLNRTESQKFRSGFALCFLNKNLWKSLRSAIITYEIC